MASQALATTYYLSQSIGNDSCDGTTKHSYGAPDNDTVHCAWATSDRANGHTYVAGTYTDSFSTSVKPGDTLQIIGSYTTKSNQGPTGHIGTGGVNTIVFWTTAGTPTNQIIITSDQPCNFANSITHCSTYINAGGNATDGVAGTVGNSGQNHAFFIAGDGGTYSGGYITVTGLEMGNTDLENTSGYCAFAAHPGFSGSGNDASPCPDGRGNANVNFTNNIVHDSDNLTGAYVCAHGTNFDGNIGYFFGFGGSSGFQGQGFYGRGLNGQMVNNVIWGDNGSGWPIQIGGYGDDPIGNWIVSNNTLVDGVNNDGCIATYNTDFTNLYMVNNICMNAKYLTASGDWNLDSIGSASYGPNWEAHNNMIYYDGGGVATNVCGGAGQNCSHVVDGQITNNYTLNTTAPGFVGSGANKYALTNSSSYAFQKGVITNAPSDAINMPARGNPYDLGAYQLLGPVTSGISYYIGNTLYTCNGQLIAVSGGGMPSPVCSITDQMTGSNNDTNNMAYEYYAGQGGYKFPSAKTPCQVNVSINSIQAGSMSGKTVRISIFKNVLFRQKR